MKILCNIKIFYKAALLVACLFFFGRIHAQDFSDVKEYAVDYTNTLTQEQLQSLRKDLSDFHREKGSQIVVVMLSSTGDKEIEVYANELFRTLKIGREKIDDGVLVLIAKDDRKMRIEVGYGLEGAIPDITAKRIIDEQMTPEFKGDHYYSGIEDGVASLEALVRGEELPPPKIRMHPTNMGIAIMLMLIAGFVLGLLGGLRRITWKTGLLILLCVAIVSCLISVSFIPLAFSPFTAFPALFGYVFGSSKKARIVLFCLIGYILIGLILRNVFKVHISNLYFVAPVPLGFISFFIFAIYVAATSKASHSRGSSSGWSSSSDSSSSWSSSSSSDSFSGGGGSSGGGGASGSW